MSGYPGLTQQGHWSTNLPGVASQFGNRNDIAFGGGPASPTDPASLNLMALEVLKKQLSGPFNEEARQSLINKGAGMTAAAEGQQQEALRASAAERGLAANDPSLQGEQRRLTAARQGANVNIAGDTRRAATTANYEGSYRAAQALRDRSMGAFGMSGRSSSQPRVSGYGGLDLKPISGPSVPIFKQSVIKKV